MRSRIYLETTIPSYLTAWPSRDLVRAAHQQITREWWQMRHAYECFLSQLVVRECQAGDKEAAAARLEVLAGLPLLEQSDAVEALARAFIDEVRSALSGGGGCTPHCDGRSTRYGLLADVELHSYCQRDPSRTVRGSLQRCRVRTAGHLHTRRVTWGRT